MDNLKIGDRFKPKDPRDKRAIRIVQLEVGSKVLCENAATGRRTRIDLGTLSSRFTKIEDE